MTLKDKLRCAGDSHPGLRRDNNEDRAHWDAERGIFLVVDGIGGQAAGEKAADVAVSMVRGRLERKTGTIEDRIREAITVANNEILRLAETKPEWRGMACVLTVAVVEDGHATIGHVGDSRLYKIRHGEIAKLTHDHSPVGEREDSGEIGEQEAMRHPRRNEVFRDVGSERHTPEDRNFIEIVRTAFEPDSAMLLCSDGLSDQVSSAQILETVQRHAGEPSDAVHDLIQAANRAGGKDNVTVLLVEGGRFEAGMEQRGSGGVLAALGNRWAFLVYGAVLGLGAWLLAQWRTVPPPPPPGPKTFLVSAQQGSFATIAECLTQAQAGDLIKVAPGTYREQVRLKTGVTLEAMSPREAVLILPAIAQKVERVRIAGFRMPGLVVSDASVEADDNEITAGNTGVEIDGESKVILRANFIHDNTGGGVSARGNSSVRLAQNTISGNGKVRGALRPGVNIVPPARASFLGNVFSDNGSQDISKTPEPSDEELTKTNWFIPLKPPRAPRAPGGRRR